MKFRKILSLILALMMLCLCACDRIDDNTPDNTVDVTPDTPPVKEPWPVSAYGSDFASAPETVASLSPALTKLLADIGVTDKIVGISDYCSLPGLELSSVGSPANPDIKSIIELRPEIVITLSPMASTDKINLSQFGITVLEIAEPKTYADLCDIYINMCRVFFGAVDSKDIAYGALLPLDSALKEAYDAELNRKFICVEGVYKGGLILSGGDTLESDILSVFGKNELGNMGSAYIEKDILGTFEPSLIFAYDSVDRDDIRDYFEDQKIIFIPESALTQPSAALSGEIERILEELK